MTIRADADLKFLRKYLFIAIACIAFALYCLLDGIVLAPKKLPRAESYAKLAEIEDTTEKAIQWQAISKEKGWSHGIPEKSPPELKSYIIWQYAMAFFSFLFGIPMILWYFKSKGTWIEADEKSIRASWGPEVSFDSIEKVDKKKWKKKGIAKVFYRHGSDSLKFVLDDFKYSRQPMGEIMRLVETNVRSEKIVNDSEGSTSDPPSEGSKQDS